MMIQSWSLLAVAGIAFLLLAPAVVWCAISLVKGNRGDTLAAAAFAPLQEVNLPSPGEIVVLVEVPRLVSDFANFQIELTEKQSGRSAVMKYSCVNAQGAVHGFDAVKVPYGRLTAPRAGVYVVRMGGLDPGKDYSKYRLLLSRPYLGRMALQIIGIVFCAVGMLLCVIWAAWLTGLMKQSYPPDTGIPSRTVDLETWKRQQQTPPK
jgi:hypothetical protein